MLILAGSLISLSAAPVWTMVPDDLLFPDSPADPDYPRFVLSFPAYLTQSIDTLETDANLSFREILKVGGVQSVFRFTPSQVHPFAVELSIGAGITTMFDTFEDNLDNFGWEGTGFVTFDFRITDPLRLRFGYHHISSHVGDEYLARYQAIPVPLSGGSALTTGLTYGMDYVRDSLFTGLSYSLTPQVRLYGEAGYSMDMLRYLLRYNDFPWQADIGVEIRWNAKVDSGSLWYSALHVSGYQETSWLPSTSVQIGRMIREEGSNRRLNLALEFFWGRPQIAVFNYTDAADPVAWDDVQKESHVAVGFWYDL